MPAESQAQRAYLNMKFGHKWVKKHHFDNPGKLPKHVKKRKKRIVPRKDANGFY
jgi:hypothetical protein